jgi:hypothetical protein
VPRRHFFTPASLQVYPLDDGNLPEILRHLYLSMFDFLHNDCFLTELYPFARRESRFNVDHQSDPLKEESSAWTVLQYWNS